MVILKGWGRYQWYNKANVDVWNLGQYNNSAPSGWGIKKDKNSEVIHLKNTVNGKKWALKGGEWILV